jgi:hypothetical protein
MIKIDCEHVLGYYCYEKRINFPECDKCKEYSKKKIEKVKKDV